MATAKAVHKQNHCGFVFLGMVHNIEWWQIWVGCYSANNTYHLAGGVLCSQHCCALQLEQRWPLPLLQICYKLRQQTFLISAHARYLAIRQWRVIYVPRLICLTLTTSSARPVKPPEKPQRFEEGSRRASVKGNAAAGSVFTGNTWFCKRIPLSPLWTEINFYRCLKGRGGERETAFSKL